jgi:hypothetical protein
MSRETLETLVIWAVFVAAVLGFAAFMAWACDVGRLLT